MAPSACFTSLINRFESKERRGPEQRACLGNDSFRAGIRLAVGKAVNRSDGRSCRKTGVATTN
jgi:hypothetical protein